MRSNHRAMNYRMWTHGFISLSRSDNQVLRQPKTSDYNVGDMTWLGQFEDLPETQMETDAGRLITFGNTMRTSWMSADTSVQQPWDAGVGDRIRMMYPSDMSGQEYTIVEHARDNSWFSTLYVLRYIE